MKNVPAPFSCEYTPQFAELLYRLNCTIALSTYQAGKLVLLSPKSEESVIQLPRTFPKVMGIAQNSKGNKLALACEKDVQIFTNAPDLAEFYPKSPKKYDALFMPRMTYHTNALDLHDLSFGENEDLYAVNTLFSCLIKLDSDHNFTPVWKPKWVDRIQGQDRCHLNGMAMSNGRPKYVTAFNTGNTPQSWRENITSSGVLVDVTTDEIICEGLPMPHSPRIFKDELYVLLSATGELARIDKDKQKYEVIKGFGGFVRGMDLIGDYLFVGISKIRKSSTTFGKLSFPKSSNQAGIVAVHLPTGSVVARLNYLASVDEIYDVNILPGIVRPNILNRLTDTYQLGVSIPGQSFWAKTSE